MIHFISFSSDELGNEMHASLSQHAAVGDRRVLSQRHTNMAHKYLIYQVCWTLTAWPRSTKQQRSHTRSNLTCTVRSLLSCFLVISEETCEFFMFCMPCYSCHPSTSPIFSFLCHSPLLGDSLVSLDRKVPQGPSFFSGHRLGSWRMCKSWIWTLDVDGKNM